MDQVTKTCTLALLLALHGSAGWASAVADSQPALAAENSVPVRANGAAAGNGFRGEACRVPVEAVSSIAELGAFEQWQGASTRAAGRTQMLVFGSMLQNVGTEPVLASPRAQAAADQEVQNGPEDSDAHQRRRMFLLGLAILLNINTKQ